MGGKLEALYWTPSGKHTGIAITYSSHGVGAGFLAAALASGAFDYIHSTELLTSAENGRGPGHDFRLHSAGRVVAVALN